MIIVNLCYSLLVATHESIIPNFRSPETSETGERDVFCLIVEHKHSAIRIFETKNASVIMDIRGYPLVLAKDHLEKSIPEILSLAGKMIIPVQKAYGASGIRIQLNYGESAGQDIFHPHVHVIPREQVSGGIGRSMTITDFDEKSKMARRIRQLSQHLVSHLDRKKM